MGGLEPWHIIVIVAVLFLLFGYRRLPSATKSIAQSMKIFRDETKGLRGEDPAAAVPAGEERAGERTTTGALSAPPVVAAPPVSPQPQPVAVTVPAPPAPAAVTQPVTAPAPTEASSGQQHAG